MKALGVMEDQEIKVDKFVCSGNKCLAITKNKAYLVDGKGFRSTPEWISGQCFISINTFYNADNNDGLYSRVYVQQRSTIYFLGDELFELTKEEVNDFVVQTFI